MLGCALCATPTIKLVMMGFALALPILRNTIKMLSQCLRSAVAYGYPNYAE